MSTDITAYMATVDASDDIFADAFKVAEYVGGSLGLTKQGRLVITVEPYTAVAAADAIPADLFPHGYVVPGTDSTLVFDL